ncbi:hypothetical protein HYFRA_00008141 [Hymenoscyphus fraxineus]|uniref:DUF3835 domain-containing protein n=1 Tax=Hymenoscyphus fraxineus TaxID=746836 RepID=A0A9N9L9C4_9HELO|nr:hypothetical protein HYFRA_00008141 [Hymenoscyphus fraxineus]
MAQAIKDSFLDLERHRKRLEENVEELRKSLRHWQTWEAEYEGLKEEILAVNPAPDATQLLEIARNYEGELVNQKEMAELLGSTSNTPRTSARIVNLLDRRLDYCEQNVFSIQRQIETAEKKLLSATIISTPDVRNEEGLPLTEIVEELDEEGNIISSHTSTPGSSKPQLLEVLKKAGVKDIPEGSLPVPETSSAKQEENEGKEEQEEKAVEPPKTPKSAKKGVKFAPDTKTGPDEKKSQTAERIEQIMSIAKQNQGRPSEPPIIPTNESPEDAALRQDMIQYSLSEVGAVVAELELEEGSDWSQDEYDDEISDTDDEDEYGRSTGRVVNDEIRQQMLALEAKLGIKNMRDVKEESSNVEFVKEGIGRITIKGDDTESNSNTSQSAASLGTSPKKAVRFSEEIDINSDPPPPPTRQTPKTAPVGNVIERTPSSQPSLPTAPKKPSRFAQERAARAANSISANTMSPNQQFPIPNQAEHIEQPIRSVPTGPEGKILAPEIVEHDIPLDASATEPDEWDPQLLHQEVATEYHKMRNRMIQREGGFMKEDESEIVPFTEEEGGPKKMSRFKAARLASAGR